jgi:hypothetical protein
MCKYIASNTEIERVREKVLLSSPLWGIGLRPVVKVAKAKSGRPPETRFALNVVPGGLEATPSRCSYSGTDEPVVKRSMVDRDVATPRLRPAAK